MPPRPPFRLALDLVAAFLLISGLAYWWLGNTAHELIGTGLFALVIAHNGFNRRWYGRIPKTRRQPCGKVAIALNLALALTMIVLLTTSLAVSRTVFGFLPFDAGVTSRTLHLLAAYWALVLVGLHVGLNWQIVMNIMRPRIARLLPGHAGILLARLGALGIAALGLYSAVEMGLGPKLINMPTMDMWDFNTQTPRFFLNWLSIIGLFAVLSHQGANALRGVPGITAFMAAAAAGSVGTRQQFAREE